MSSLRSQRTRERFAEIVARDEDRINLGEAALLIAAEEYPHLDVGTYLDRLDYFGDLARKSAGSAQRAGDIISAINHTLFETLGFRANRENYYDPRNSFLNQVLDRRIGIPITLSLVYIEVASRIGFTVKGVGLPFHFVVKHEAPEGDIFIDAFNSGRLLGPVGCAELVREMSGGKLELRAEHLAAVGKKQMLSRMLSNLVGIYSASDQPRALATIDRILLISPDSAPHIRDRGLLLARTGDGTAAINELERYLELAPEAPDAESVRARIQSVRQRRARLN